MNEISLLKKYKTRDGKDVRLLCTDGPGEYPVIGIVDGLFGVNIWSMTGESYVFQGAFFDLVEVSKTVPKTFYRRKWFLHSGRKFAVEDYNYYPSKELFDNAYAVKEHGGTWSDEWETITVEVPV